MVAQPKNQEQETSGCGKLLKFEYLEVNLEVNPAADSPPGFGVGQAIEAQPLGAADGHRQGVRGVAGPVLPPRGEDQAHHAGDLVLAGAAIAGDGGLDLGGAV